ncbi:MAG: amidase, partial [Candidatus Binatia bacterium]
MKSRHLQRIAQSLAVTTLFDAVAQAQPARANKKFEIVEATIADIHKAIRSKQLTVTQLVNLYLARIKAYNGTCVNEPQGILGPVSPIANAGAINALMTLNLR